MEGQFSEQMKGYLFWFNAEYSWGSSRTYSALGYHIQYSAQTKFVLKNELSNCCCKI